MTPERRTEMRLFRTEGIAYCQVTPSEVIALLDALEESDLAYRGQGATTRALLTDRDAEITRLRKALERASVCDASSYPPPQDIARKALEPR